METDQKEEKEEIRKSLEKYAKTLAGNTDFVQNEEDKIDIYRTVGEFQDQLNNELYLKIDSKKTAEDEFLEVIETKADYGSNNNLLIDISFTPNSLVKLQKKHDLILYKLTDRVDEEGKEIETEEQICKIFKDHGEMTDRYFHIGGVEFPVTDFRLNRSRIEITCDLLNYEV